MATLTLHQASSGFRATRCSLRKAFSFNHLLQLMFIQVMALIFREEGSFGDPLRNYNCRQD